MAEIKIACSSCGQHIQCGEEYQGTQFNCPKCQKVIIVPILNRKSQTNIAQLQRQPSWLESQWRPLPVFHKIWVIFFGVTMLAVLVCSVHDLTSNQPWCMRQSPSQVAPVQTEQSKPQPPQLPTQQIAQRIQTATISDESKQEFADFVSANLLFNQQDYTNALTAYKSFIKKHPSSSRISIVRERMTDLEQIISSQIAANERGIEEEFAKMRAAQLSSPYAARDGHGVFNYPGAVLVKGYGKTKSDAFNAALNQVPQGDETVSVEYYPVSIENMCCEISYKP